MNITKKVKFIQTFSTARQSFCGGETYEIDPDEANQVIRAGLAIEIEEPEPVEVPLVLKRKAKQ